MLNENYKQNIRNVPRAVSKLSASAALIRFIEQFDDSLIFFARERVTV